MFILFILAGIVVMYTAISSIVKRKNKEKSLENLIQIELKTYVSYGSFLYSIFLSIFVGYLLFDKATGSIDVFSFLLVVLIAVLGLFKFITQKIYNPIISNEGILFYNGLFLEWCNVQEIRGETKKDEGIVLIGGTVNFKSVVREKISVPTKSIEKFEILINTKTKLN